MDGITTGAERLLDSRWGRVIAAADTALGVAVGVLAFFGLAGATPGARLAVALGVTGGAVAVVAVLATVLTLVAVLLDSDAYMAFIDRLGGRADAMFPYWFHGYLGAATVGVGLVAAATSSAYPLLSRWLVAVAAGALTWSAFGVVDLTRHTIDQRAWHRSIESSVAEARRRNSA